MSTARLASAVGEAEGRTETRRAASARAREPDTSLVLVAAPVQGGRGAKPMRTSRMGAAGFAITLSKAHR